MIATLLTLALAATSMTPPADAPLRLVLTADQPPAQGPSASFDFDFLPEQKRTPEDAAKVASLERALRVRRSLLTLHQAFGIATVALLAATVVLGQLSYSDKFGGPDTGKYEVAHDYLEAGATLAFATTGLLALFAPVPVPKKANGTILIHKIAMATAAAGFVAEIILGIVTVSLEGHENQQTLGTAHLICGYSTTAATATGVGVLFFP